MSTPDREATGFITPRELYDRLERLDASQEARLDHIDEKLDNRLALIEAAQDEQTRAQIAHEKDDDRRFGRMEKGLLLLGVAIASPKLGGPDAAHVVSTVVQTWLSV